jgi:hypothetical protein
MSDVFQTTTTSVSGFSPPPLTPQDYAAEGEATRGSATDVAKDQASEVAATAKRAGGQIKDAVTEQAGAITAEAGRQARQLLGQARSELTEQAAQQQQRVAGGLHSLADELDGMVEGSAQDGVATDLARMGADKARDVAQWLDGRDPGSLIDEVRSYARRRPGTYLAIALGAGLLAGRLTRGLTASSAGASGTSADRSGETAYRPVAGLEPIAATPPVLEGFRPTPAIGGDGDRTTSGNGAANGVIGDPLR